MTSLVCLNYITQDVKNISYCEFGIKPFTQNYNGVMFEYVPSVIVFHSLTPPSLKINSGNTYNSYLGRFNNNTTIIYVPDSAVNLYKETWAVHASRIHPLSEYEGQTYY